MNKKIAEALREIHIGNDWDLRNDGEPSVSSAVELGGTTAFHLDIKGKGYIRFSYLGRHDKPNALQKALARCKEMFPKVVMVKSPFFQYSYVPEESLKRALDKIKQEETK